MLAHPAAGGRPAHRAPRPAALAVVAVVVGWLLGSVLGGCGGRADGAAFEAALCGSVVDFADDGARAVNRFQADSAALDDPAARRARYLRAFDDLELALDRLAAGLTRFPYPAPSRGAVRSRLEIAVGRMRAEYADGRTEAVGLPERSYTGFSVPDGHLVTGNEKARAILFDTLARLASDLGVVGAGCGRRDPLSVELGAPPGRTVSS